MNNSCSNDCQSQGTSECNNCPENKINKIMMSIKNKILVLSGKGGVGKSSVAVNLAATLSQKGFSVGLLDIDFHGPSIPTMLGLQNSQCLQTHDGCILPIEIGSLKVISIPFLMENKDDAIIWRGPMKSNVLRQLFENTHWGELDYLIMDFPPGTGDEVLSACQMVKGASGGIIVTTPQEVSLSDCRKCISFCETLKLPILGVIENMSGVICPDCEHEFEIFDSGGGENMAKEKNIPFLGKLPLDPRIAKCSDNGVVFIEKHSEIPASKAFNSIIDNLINT